MEAATFTSLHTKLLNSSSEILRNRPGILTLLHSLSEKASPALQPAPFSASVKAAGV